MAATSRAATHRGATAGHRQHPAPCSPALRKPSYNSIWKSCPFEERDGPPRYAVQGTPLSLRCPAVQLSVPRHTGLLPNPAAVQRAPAVRPPSR